VTLDESWLMLKDIQKMLPKTFRIPGISTEGFKEMQTVDDLESSS